MVFVPSQMVVALLDLLYSGTNATNCLKMRKSFELKAFYNRSEYVILTDEPSNTNDVF